MAVILVVEDSLLSRRTIAKILRLEGYEIIEAVNGKQAIERVTKFAPDCILLDLLMPDMDGREVLQILRQKQIATPVIVVTADIQHTSRQQCLDLGAYTVIHKLPDPKLLCSAVSLALRVHQDAHPCSLPLIS